MQPEPFTVAIPDEAVADLKERLRRTKFAPDFGNDDWRYGVDRHYLESFVRSWIDYDWREAEAEINAFANYKVDFDGIPIHFIHERGKGPNPLPVILTHGWPWTFWDFKDVIRPLTDPAAFGGDPADAFDVVVPSLPGFGFSTPLRIDGVNTHDAVDLWARLMTDVLGYERFGAAGGDFGAAITAELGHKYGDRVAGIHVTIPPGLSNRRPATPPREPSTMDLLLGILNGPASRSSREEFAPDERERYDLMARRWETALAHVAVHTTDPQTLAYAYHDSPVGLAAWLIEKRRHWSDNDGDVEQAFSRRFLLDLVSIYWFTDSFFTSARWYWHTFRNPWKPAHDRNPAIEVPVGVPIFPKEMVFRPRKAVEADANLVHWTIQPRGGHFAAAEVPNLFVDDLRAFFRALR